MWFLAAEALAVFKLLFFRSKDLVDLERLVAVSGGSMNLNAVRSHVVKMMGGNDPRVSAWARFCTDHARELKPARGSLRGRAD